MAPWNFLDAPSTGIREVRSDEPGCLLHPQLPPQDPSLSSHRGGQNKELVTGQLCARLFPLLGRQQSARPARSRTSHLQGLVAAVRKVTWIPVCWDGFNSNGEKKYSFFLGWSLEVPRLCWSCTTFQVKLELMLPYPGCGDSYFFLVLLSCKKKRLDLVTLRVLLFWHLTLREVLNLFHMPPLLSFFMLRIEWMGSAFSLLLSPVLLWVSANRRAGSQKAVQPREGGEKGRH